MEAVLIGNSIVMWVVLIFNLVLILAVIRRLNASGESANQNAELLNIPAPNFVAETLEGRQVTLANYANKVVAFIFFSTQCGPCLEALPDYETLGQKAAQAGVEIVLVSTGLAEATRDFVQHRPINLPIILAPAESNSFMEDYKITGTPSYCLVDAEGIIRSSGYPSKDFGDWKTLSQSWESQAGRTNKLLALSK